ncbi:DNA-protecting protein DprA [Flammeovirga pectinis]|uniref:DNA-protecting protein DprA n=1 Tax=Flammeovirga pectinis TaxID=2494373 RepID=A0A3S9P1A7_9BACT|nr:DNA-processing protein DprA [Flammeovirga pectinis]AZQ61950.1 DNA-protecting protein DprA [Flammeovirga pectinis]
MTESKLHELWLNSISGIGGATCKLLISHLGSAEAVFKANDSTLLKINGIGEITAKSIVASRQRINVAEKELEKVVKSNARVLTYLDDEFPKRLKLQKDAPYLIYVKGRATGLNSQKNIAIVGSRNATDYGTHITQKIIERVNHLKGVNIISGLAYGIDIAAHKAALKNNIGTIGVMANGLNLVYPSIHKNTAQQMLTDNQSGLITENPMDAQPDGPKFPARNRIIAALADAVIVVQAKKKGGALITADIGNSYHKDVFAVPGLITDPLAEGCNNLIKHHRATLFSDVDDFIKTMNWDTTTPSPSKQMHLFQPQDLDPLEQKVAASIQKSPLHIEEISIQSQIPLAKLASTLLQLELKGVIKMKPGNIYTLNT